MEVVVITAVVEAIVRVVAKKLVLVTAENINFFLDFNQDLKNLQSSIDMIEKVLNDGEMRQVTDMAVKKWLQNLEDVAFETDYVLDKFTYRHLRRSVKSKLTLILSASNYFTRLRLGRKIRDINTKLESINREAQSFGLQTRLAVTHAADPNASASSGTDSFAADPIFLGRDDDVSTIVAKLTDRSRREKTFSVIPIVGMGGSGKTMLARKIYHDAKMKSHFGARSWVHVSENFDPVIVFKKFLNTLTSQTNEVGVGVGGENREAILKKLEEALRDKVYFLVIDDVWEQSIQKWENFMKSLSGVTSLTGNGIIVTCRNTNVASSIVSKPLHTHHLNCLSGEDCWLIIKKKTMTSSPSEFEAIGRRIARRCQGLPLAANVVGGVLRGKSEEMWRKIEADRLSLVEGDESYIKNILRLSFDYLHSPILKKCFTYCSVFPKGEEIEREELIQLWMAEGFLQSDPENDMESVGNNFLDLLLQSSLLQVVEKDKYGNITRCGVHDLVHDLAFSLVAMGSPANDSRARYLGYESKPMMKESKYLRTLFYRDGSVPNFRRLHALTLTGHGVTKLSASITKLIHLRFLNISCTGITSLPNSMDDLCFLQTFRANRGKLMQLPTSFTYLISLRHLHIDAGVVLPPDIGRVASLRTLPHFRVSSNRGCRIGELGSLQNLKGKLRIDNHEEVHDEEEAKKANLCEKPNLLKLRFAWDKYKQSEANGKNVLAGLQPHTNLKCLSIQGFQSTSFPSWTKTMAVRNEAQGKWLELNCLVKIKLSHCNCEEIPRMGHLPNLRFLHLKSLPNVRSIDSSFYGIDEKQRVVLFPALERLALTHMPSLTEWEGVELSKAMRVWVFPRLEYLRIHQCKQLKRAPSHFPSLKELDIHEMDSGRPLADICGVRLTTLTQLSIRRIDGLENLPDRLFYNNQSLSNLNIKQCTKLGKLPAGLDTLKSLKSLSLVSLSTKLDIPNIITYLGKSSYLTHLTIK